MIQTVIIDVINEKALRLLEDLESLQLIRLRKEHYGDASTVSAIRHKGAMVKQSPDEIDRQLHELRDVSGCNNLHTNL